jgi:hypothetical protein
VNTGSLTATQRAYAAISEALHARHPQPNSRIAEQAQISYCAGLRRAMEIVAEIDPDADWGEAVPGRVY